MRILLIEDDDKLASFIVKGLKEDGFAVDRAGDGDQGLELALANTYDALVVDIMLPKRDGLTVIEDVRKVKTRIPILILSAKRSVEERVRGLRIGSDDYLTKPFAFVELLARLHALLRRFGNNSSSTRLEAGNLFLDLLSRKVSCSGQQIELNPKEFSILEYLMRHAGEVVSRTMLIEHVWGFQFDPGTNVVDVHICHLREKVDKEMIVTIRGVGYVLKSPE